MFLVGEEDGVLIAVNGQGDAIAAHHLAEQLEVFLGVLALAEAGPRDHARGVVDAAHQAQPRPPSLQPVVAAAVDLQEHAGAGHALPAATMPRRPPGAHRSNPRPGEDALHAGPRQRNPFVLGEHLGEVLAVKAGIGAGGQLHNSGGHAGVDGMDRAPTPVAVDQCCRPALAVGSSQPPHLPDRDAQQLCCFGVDQRSRLEVVEHQQPSLFFLVQGDPVLHKRTNSQNS